MDRKERINKTVTALQEAMGGWQQKMWTALPGILQSFDASKMSAVVQPSIQSQLRDPDTGEWSNVTLPLCLDCPVVFPGGGGFGVTFPLADGDEGLIVFASRCIDSWWQSGGVQPQAEYRMHDLSDGFFIPGAFSNSRVPDDVSTTTARFWKNDGTMYVELGASGVLTLKAPVRIVLDAPITHIIGGLAIDGTVSGVITGGGTVNFGDALIQTSNDVEAGGVSLVDHTHSGVIPGGGSSGPPE